MRSMLHRSLLSIAILAHAASCVVQANAITAAFIGNCGLHLTDGTWDLHVDLPYKSGAYGHMEYPGAEVASMPSRWVAEGRVRPAPPPFAAQRSSECSRDVAPA